MFKQYLALSPKFLTRLSYHSILGLGLDRSGHKNFYEIVQELHKNFEQRQAMIDRVNNILSKPGVLGFIVGLFYWVFNINRYCQDYYQLQAYYSWRLYEEGINMFSENERPLIEQQNGFISEQKLQDTSIASKAYDVVKTVVITPIDWVVVKPTTFIVGGILGLFTKSKSEDSPLKSLPHEETHFKVTQRAQEYLEVLGITDIERGSQYAINDVKKQYKKLCLKHHPDKGGNAEEFTPIAEAYKNLLTHISPDKNFLGLEERSAERFAEWKREDERVDQCIKRSSETTKRASQTIESVHEFCIAQRKFLEDVRKECDDLEKKHQEDMAAIDSGIYTSDHEFQDDAKTPSTDEPKSMFGSMCSMFCTKRDSQVSTDNQTDNSNSYS